MKFAEWKNELNVMFALNYFGIDTEDVDDYNWRDLYDEEYTVEQAFMKWDREERWKYEQ
jgi:uncharacterized SAM-dependent methyltransferase